MQRSSATTAIYISYAWGSESEVIAEAIEKEFQNRGLPILRDKKVLGYKGRIKEFTEHIGRSNYVILVISNKYLHSINCMFEMVQILKNEHFYERIFPVVLDEVKIADPSERIRLISYWENETESLTNEIKQLKDLSNIQGLTDDLNLNSEIRDNIARLTDILKDTNTLSIDQLVDSDFEQLFVAVQDKIKADSKKEIGTGKNLETNTDAEEHGQNIFVRIKAKLFGTTAFFEVANKNRRRVISFGITAIVGICAIFLALPHLFQNPDLNEGTSDEKPQVTVTESPVVTQEDNTSTATDTVGAPEEKKDTHGSNIRYNVELFVPSDMAKAEVFVDGKPAEIIDRSLISITVRLRKKNGSHHFEVKDGSVVCKTDKLIVKDKVQITICE